MKKIKEKVLKFFEISSKLKRTGAFVLAFLLSFLAIAQGIRAGTEITEISYLMLNYFFILLIKIHY